MGGRRRRRAPKRAIFGRRLADACFQHTHKTRLGGAPFERPIRAPTTSFTHRILQVLPWLLETLKTAPGSVERSGAAQGLAEVLAALGDGATRKVLNDLLPLAQHPLVNKTRTNKAQEARHTDPPYGHMPMGV